MALIKYALAVLFLPIKDYLRKTIKAIYLKYKHPTLIMGNNVNVSMTSKLGINNYLSHNSSLIESSMGNYSYLGDNTMVQNTDIGKFTCIGPNVKIGLGEHPINDFISIHPIFYSMKAMGGALTFADRQYFNEYKQVSIGHDVWIGANAVVMGGLSIGNGCVVAAGAIVTKDVPAYAIVGGVPAKIIRYKYPEDIIAKLEQRQWWNLSPKWLKKNHSLMMDINNIEKLFEN